MARRFISGVVLSLVAAALAAGCATGGLRQAQAADQLQDHDLAVARYSRVLRDNPDHAEARQGLERAKLRASDEHFIRGRRLYSQGRIEDAVLEFQLAAELNPGNADAERNLQEARVALRAQLSETVIGQTSLQTLLARTQDLAPGGDDLPEFSLPA